MNIEKDLLNSNCDIYLKDLINNQFGSGNSSDDGNELTMSHSNSVLSSVRNKTPLLSKRKDKNLSNVIYK